MRGTDHRKKSKKSRSGRNRYEKGRRHYGEPTRITPKKPGATTSPHNPDLLRSTLADVWPTKEEPEL